MEVKYSKTSGTVLCPSVQTRLFSQVQAISQAEELSFLQHLVKCLRYLQQCAGISERSSICGNLQSLVLYTHACLAWLILVNYRKSKISVRSVSIGRVNFE